MGFFQQMTVQYGREVGTNMKTWANLNIKLASWRNRRIYLLQCKRQGIKPAHITNNIKCLYSTVVDGMSANEIDRFNYKVVHKILLTEIRITVKRIVEMERESSLLWQSLGASLPSHILNEFKRRNIIKYNRQFNIIKNRNRNKIEKLKQNTLKQINSSSKWFKNVSNIQIPDDIRSFLSLGPRFSVEIPKKEVSVQKLLADVDNIINRFQGENRQNILRAKTTYLITEFLKKTPDITNNFQSLYYKTKKFLKDNPELLILKADKGNVTVAMNKHTYGELAESILGDEKYYKKINKNPTITIQNKCNEKIKQLASKQYITQDVAKSLYNYNAVPPRFYGLPKVHKQELSLRPIVSSINTPTSKLSTYIANILNASFDDSQDRYFIKDSFHFASLINNFQLPPEYVLVSFDVVSLYSNIPIDLLVEAVKDKWEKIAPHTLIPRDDFLVLIVFIFNNNYFTYGEEIYSQIFGCPMGSSLSPVTARIVMDFVLDSILSKIHFEIPFIKKYVDDIILALPNNKVNDTLTIFNNYNKHIQFTIEEESDRSVPFLDTRLIRTANNVIILDWYTKPCSSNRYVHYYSNHPKKQKINLILALKNRILRISHSTLLNKNLNKLNNILIENGYPKYLLRPLIFNTNSRNDNRENSEVPGEEVVDKMYFTLPIIGGLTSKLIQALKTDNIMFAKKNEFTINKLFSKTKNRIPKELSKDVVYQIPCSSCNKVYIGQTSQQLKKRVSQHKSDLKNPNKTCALALHCRGEKHTADFDNVKILEVEPIGRKRNFLEMYHIVRTENTLNCKTDVQGISNIYSYLISDTK